MTPVPYVLVTAARNEEKYIEQAIRSVLSQTVQPQRWVIVSDGSTDATDVIVQRYAEAYPWINLVRAQSGSEHSFRKQARSQNIGYGAVQCDQFEVIGFIDGDTTIPPDLCGYLLSKFSADLRLGVAGCPYIVEGDDVGARHFYDTEHVHGACQFFRRSCFEQIGSFLELETGGHDKVAIVLARMNGWSTRSFLDRRVTVHKAVGFGDRRTAWRSRFKYGCKDYVLGNGVLWEAGRSLYQMAHRPYLLGGLALFAGYLYASQAKMTLNIPREVRRQVQREQHRRIFKLLLSSFASH